MDEHTPDYLIRQVESHFEQGRLEKAISQTRSLCKFCIDRMNLSYGSQKKGFDVLHSDFRDLENRLVFGQITQNDYDNRARQLRLSFWESFLELKDNIDNFSKKSIEKKEWEAGEFRVILTFRSFETNKNHTESLFHFITEMVKKEIRTVDFHFCEDKSSIDYIPLNVLSRTKIDINQKYEQIVKPSQSDIDLAAF